MSRKRSYTQFSEDDEESTSTRRSKRIIKEKKIFDPALAYASNRVSGALAHSAESIIEEDMKDCYYLLVRIMEMPMANNFLEPFNFRELSLLNYPEVVKVPMDLGQIKQMLLHNTLENPEHFAEHVRLTFKNSINFNPIHTELNESASKLLQVFEERYKTLCDSWESEAANEKKPDEPEITEEERVKQLESDMKDLEIMQNTITSLKYSIDEIKKEITTLQKTKRTPKPKKVRLSAPKPPLTYKEKEELCKKIENLSPENLPGLLEIMQTPGSTSGNDDELVIDIEKVDDLKLLEVKKYVDKCTAKKPKSTSKPRNRSRKPKPDPVANSAKMVLAEAQTSQRISAIEKQIQDMKRQQL